MAFKDLEVGFFSARWIYRNDTKCTRTVVMGFWVWDWTVAQATYLVISKISNVKVDV